MIASCLSEQKQLILLTKHISNVLIKNEIIIAIIIWSHYNNMLLIIKFKRRIIHVSSFRFIFEINFYYNFWQK
jgi:hypothetical protein